MLIEVKFYEVYGRIKKEQKNLLEHHQTVAPS